MIRRNAPLALLLAFAACGGEPSPDAAGSPQTDDGPLPAGTDILLAELRSEDGIPTGIGEPRNVTRRAGYDNQPYFLPDGSGFWYTTIDSLGEADIERYDIATGETVDVTTSAPESEYSATPLPGGGGFSAIRVEADSTQRLWRFVDGAEPTVILPSVAPVGYHAWAGPDRVVLFVLGAPPTLQVGDLHTGEAHVVARDIGRSLQHIPGGNDVSFVQRLPDGGTEIRRLNPASGTIEPIAPGVDGGDFHAWTPSGVLLQARDGRVYRWSGTGWEVIGDLSARRIRLTRLSVAPGGDRIALVAEPDDGRRED